MDRGTTLPLQPQLLLYYGLVVARERSPSFVHFDCAFGLVHQRVQVEISCACGHIPPQSAYVGSWFHLIGLAYDSPHGLRDTSVSRSIDLVGLR